MHSRHSGTPAPTLTNGGDRINELAWNSFAAFINSEGDEFLSEPTEDDYLRDALALIYYNILYSLRWIV